MSFASDLAGTTGSLMQCTCTVHYSGSYILNKASKLPPFGGGGGGEWMDGARIRGATPRDTGQKLHSLAVRTSSA